MNEKERDVWQEVLDGVQEIKAGGGRRLTVKISPAMEARSKIGMPQAQFAKLLGVSKRPWQDWEQGRRNPSGAARSLLTLALKRPDVLEEVLG